MRTFIAIALLAATTLSLPGDSEPLCRNPFQNPSELSYKRGINCLSMGKEWIVYKSKVDSKLLPTSYSCAIVDVYDKIFGKTRPGSTRSLNLNIKAVSNGQAQRNRGYVNEKFMSGEKFEFEIEQGSARTQVFNIIASEGWNREWVLVGDQCRNGWMFLVSKNYARNHGAGKVEGIWKTLEAQLRKFGFNTQSPAGSALNQSCIKLKSDRK